MKNGNVWKTLVDAAWRSLSSALSVSALSYGRVPTTAELQWLQATYGLDCCGKTGPRCGQNAVKPMQTAAHGGGLPCCCCS